MKQYLCIYCQLNDPDAKEDPNEYFINENNFVEHLEHVHHKEVRTLEATLNSLRTLGMLTERIID